MNTILEKAEQKLELLAWDDTLARYIDTKYHIPQPYVGNGTIGLIVLGQDPTIKDIEKRKKIKTVLNLDTNGSARAYLSDLCQKTGIDVLQNIYATNLFKNFFTFPPTEIKEINIFKVFLDFWLPLLIEELSPFDNVPVITLGEPVLRCILKEERSSPLREHWGYTPEWKNGKFGSLKYVKPDDNFLGRILFPFPHQPTLRKRFYKMRKDDYIAFAKVTAFSI